MGLSFILVFIFSVFQSGFCENCSEASLENFQKTFNLSDKCGDCTILDPESYFDNENWSGICSPSRCLIFPERKCGNLSESFALVSQNACEILDENNFGADYDDCFAKFIDEKCANLTRLKPESSMKVCENSFVREGWRNSRGERERRQASEYVPDALSKANGSFVTDEWFGTNESKQRIITTELRTTVATSENAIRTKRTSRESISTEETEITEPTVTENTKATVTESTKGTKPTVTEGTESTKLTVTEGTESTKPTVTEGTESTKPTVTEGTESTKPTVTEGTESTKPTVTEGTERTDPTSTGITKQTAAQETSSIEPTTTSDPVTTATTVFESTNGPLSTPPSRQEICEPNEYFFDSHCYFLKLHDTPKGSSGKSDTSKNLVSICSTQHRHALGLAVETKKENEFVIQTLKRIYFLNQTLVLTSGLKTGKFEGVWLGWNRKIDHAVLNLGKIDPNSKHYIINSCKGYWELWDGNPESRKVVTMCERPYNPKNIVEDLYRQCIVLYRNSRCYNKDKHANFCCTRDENGEIWFACPDDTLVKSYQGDIHCFWRCLSVGHFSPFRPVCRGNVTCRAEHNGVTYIAPVTTYAVSNCPKNSTGYSTWYCGPNQTFVGLPDYSLCCQNPIFCTETDIFLNMWTGCPSKKVIKKTTCPRGSALNEAYVEWYCHANGSFHGSTPDYSNCNRTGKKECSKKDRYGVQWVADLGTTTYKSCPPSFVGLCWWRCKESGEFDSSEPDCTWCRAKWMDNVADKIKSNYHHEEVITVMEEYTQKEDMRIGYGHVLNLTAECVSLYKKQNIDTVVPCHHKFLKGYSKIFKNIAGSPTLWSSFSVSSRREYAEDVIEITQDASFANLKTGKAPFQSYNATLADLKADGFDFFVAYSPSIKGCKFPLENPLASDWHVEIKEVNESNSNYAAMGLVMNHTLSSLMFPQGEEKGDEEMNAPALTLAVAFSSDGKVVVDRNVSVSVSFKHISRTRFPEVVEIRRRLHKGEKPSGVFNSTVCYYYSDAGWSADGCSVTYTSKDRTDCTCTHLSTIGLLMTIHKYVPDRTLEIISIVSSGITILSLILALLVFYFFDTVKNDRVLIGKNLCFCLLLGHVMLITVMDKRFFYIPDEYCKIYAVILHYVFVAAFAWMFVEGCHLYRMLVLVFDSSVEYRWVYLLTGYGVPLVVVGATHLIGFALQEQPYGQDELCWLKHPNYVWAFIGPVIVITSINFYILIIAMKLAVSSRIRTEHSNLTSFKLWLKGWFTLSTLLGITWLFGLALISHNKILLYCFVIFNGLQGFFIFLFRFMLNEQYKDVFLKRLKSLSSTLSSKHKKEDVVKSETKVFVISASKCLSSSETKTKLDACDLELLGGLLDGKIKSKSDVENPEVDGVVTLKPVVSEAYLRNRMIAHNFAARRSKATWLNECDNFRYKF